MRPEKLMQQPTFVSLQISAVLVCAVPLVLSSSASFLSLICASPDHDHEQTPGWTGGELRKTGTGGPDGICHGDAIGNSGKGCDCGADIECGEYLW